MAYTKKSKIIKLQEIISIVCRKMVKAFKFLKIKNESSLFLKKLLIKK
jgi:hypothetical protein